MSIRCIESGWANWGTILLLCGVSIVTNCSSGQGDRYQQGLVLDAVSAPVSGAEIRIKGTTTSGTPYTEVLKTENDGSFCTRTVWRSAVATVFASGYANAKFSLPTGLRTLRGVVRLAKRARLEGSIRAAESGALLPGVLTITTNRPGDVRTRTIRVENGHFSVEDLPIGPTVLLARAADRVVERREVLLSSSPVDLSVDFDLSSSVTVTGRVLTPRGGVAADIDVKVDYLAHPREIFDDPLMPRARTNASGEFYLTGVRPFADFRVVASRYGARGLVTISQRSPKETVQAITITLEKYNN
jgi:hypothetical protein